MPFLPRKNISLYLMIVTFLEVFAAGVLHDRALGADTFEVPIQRMFHSEALGKDKNILISLPRDYDLKTTKLYPVLYVLNRMENFQIARQITTFLAEKGNIPEMIIVGVPHSGDAYVEYTPYQEHNQSQRRSAADELQMFLKAELIPFIDKQYRTRPSRMLVGHSLAGLFTMDVFLNDPKMFNAYIALSPSYHHGVEILKAADRSMQKLRLQDYPVFYSNIGGDEYYKIADKYQEMQSIFQNRAPQELRWMMKVADNNSHRVMPMLGLYDGLVSIFEGYNLSMPQFRRQQYDGVINHYQKLSGEIGYVLQPTRGDIESLRNYFSEPERIDDAEIAREAKSYVKAADRLLKYYYGE